MPRPRKVPLQSAVQLDGLTAFLVQAPPEVRDRFEDRVTELVGQGHTPTGAKRIAWREWTEGRLKPSTFGS